MATALNAITSPGDPAFGSLLEALSARADDVAVGDDWPEKSLRLCAKYGVYRWFLSEEQGGLGWSEADLVRGYMRLSGACMNTTFVLTQATGALRRIAAAAEPDVRHALLPSLLAGETFTTLGISHLTTSRRHLKRPVLMAEETATGFLLDGFSPWVTGGIHANWIATGAQMEDGRQVLVLLPMDSPGVTCDEPSRLVALSASCTGAVRLDRVELDRKWLIGGPEPDVIAGATGAKTGGLQTSALAIGLAGRAIEYLEQESDRRDNLSPPTESLRDEQRAIEGDLLAMAEGQPVCSNDELRANANSLVPRATQAALAAAKGTGFVEGHPAGRWCTEALFFLVWSCPQPVMAANLCEFAGITD